MCDLLLFITNSNISNYADMQMVQLFYYVTGVWMKLWKWFINSNSCRRWPHMQQSKSKSVRFSWRQQNFFLSHIKVSHKVHALATVSNWISPWKLKAIMKEFTTWITSWFGYYPLLWMCIAENWIRKLIICMKVHYG